MPDNRRCRKRGVRVPSAPNPRLSRSDLANDTARAAEREGINVSDDVLHELRKCIKRGGGSNLSISRLRHDITEFLLMYLRVYCQRPSAKRIGKTLKKYSKQLSAFNAPCREQMIQLIVCFLIGGSLGGYYAGGPEWTEFLALADKFEEMGLTNFPDILELAHTFIVTARAHCWLRKCILSAGRLDCRALPFRRMTTPCHSGSRENGHTPWLRA